MKLFQGEPRVPLIRLFARKLHLSAEGLKERPNKNKPTGDDG